MISSRFSFDPVSTTMLRSGGQWASSVLRSGFRDDDELRTGDVAVMFEEREGYHFQCFGETLRENVR